MYRNFKDLFIGKNAKEKRIPSIFYTLPHFKIKELLKSYFSGEGSVEKNRLHVTCSSVNKELLRDIGFSARPNAKVNIGLGKAKIPEVT